MILELIGCVRDKVCEHLAHACGSCAAAVEDSKPTAIVGLICVVGI